MPTTTAAPLTTTSTTTTVPRTTTTTTAPLVTLAPPQSVHATATTTTQVPIAAAAPACAPGLASSLASTGSAAQLITAVSSGYGSDAATVQLWDRVGGCWVSAGGPWPAFIGASGFSDDKREGDGTSPTGLYGIGPVMYGNAANPGAREPYHLLQCGDWWDEDPASAQYNTFQHVACGTTPAWAPGSEALWTETAPYPSFAVVEYNTAPVVAGRGSAIFLHASTGGGTAGCVSIPRADLDQTLRWIDPARAPAIVMGPASEIARF